MRDAADSRLAGNTDKQRVLSRTENWRRLRFDCDYMYQAVLDSSRNTFQHAADLRPCHRRFYLSSRVGGIFRHDLDIVCRR